MSTVSSTSALSRAAEDTLPMKVHLADDDSRATVSDTCSGSDPDHSDTDEDLASEPWTVGPIAPPPGLELEVRAPCPHGPPGVWLEARAPADEVALARRTPLRSQAAAYSPLRSRAEEFVPKSLALAGGQRAQLGGADPKAPLWTTVMMRNVPLSYTCDTLIDLLESKGFSKWVDFVYVPIKRTEVLGVGYAFVNLLTPERAEEFILAFEGFDDWASSLSKVACAMHWSICQGLPENINRYRNSPLMHDDVPAFYKPVLLKNGVRIPFPRPTKQLPTRRKDRMTLERIERIGLSGLDEECEE